MQLPRYARARAADAQPRPVDTFMPTSTCASMRNRLTSQRRLASTAAISPMHTHGSTEVLHIGLPVKQTLTLDEFFTE